MAIASTFIQFIMDVFHLFGTIHGDDLDRSCESVHETTTFEDLVTCVRKPIGELSISDEQYVATVLEVIDDYRKELLLKDIIKTSYQSVYLDNE